MKVNSNQTQRHPDLQILRTGQQYIAGLVSKRNPKGHLRKNQVGRIKDLIRQLSDRGILEVSKP